MTLQSEVRPLRRVLLRHAREAFGSSARIANQWRSLNYLGEPDFDRACREYDAFASLLESLGTHIEWAGGDQGQLSIDALYVRDAAVVSDAGAVLCRMGKRARAAEPDDLGVKLAELGLPMSGRITGPGTLEGGDVVWLDESTVAVGRGYRTNQEGANQLTRLLPEAQVLSVPLPHWNGPGDVLHLMSMLSPLGPDLLLVYSPLMPVPFREELLARGFDLVEVPREEFDSQGCNVLAVAPRVAVAVEGNPETRRRMEERGVEVHTFEGIEISLKGCGGPTCLTRPLERT